MEMISRPPPALKKNRRAADKDAKTEKKKLQFDQAIKEFNEYKK
jgi:hypothetical protein